MFNRGDSGGPLLFNGFVVGVASQHGGHSGLAAGVLGYYAKVSPYSSWILSHLADDECTIPASIPAPISGDYGLTQETLRSISRSMAVFMH